MSHRRRRRGPTPIDIIRRDLLSAIRREEARATRLAIRRRRQRMMARAVAVITVLAGGTAGAGAAILGSTGVPALDRLLSVRQTKQQDSASSTSAAGGGGHERRPSIDHRPQPGSVSKPIVAPWGDGTHSATYVAYLTENNEVCLAIVQTSSARARPGIPRRAMGGCQALTFLGQKLTKGPGYSVAMFRAGVAGYTRRDVTRVAVTVPKGSLPVRLSEPWTPAPGATPIRTFVASDPPPRQPKHQALSPDPRKYKVRVEFRKGPTK